MQQCVYLAICAYEVMSTYRHMYCMLGVLVIKKR